MTASAYSIDGRTFTFETSLDQAFPTGSYVTLTGPEDHVRLGQVLRVSVEADGGGRVVTGRGNLLGDLPAADADAAAEPHAFEAVIAAADHHAVASHFGARTGSSAALALGSIQRMPAVPALLHAKGFGRHTFLCGQSGSGKTYTLGVVLERLLLETDIRIATIDPNSDYVNLESMRPQADTGLPGDEYEALATRFASEAPRIHVFGGESAPHRLRATYGRLSFRQQTMVLGLDPIADAEEYNAFVRTVRSIETPEYTLDDVMAAVRASFDDDVRRVGLRIQNLGVADQSIWAGREEAVMDVLPEDWRMLVADLGSLPSAQEGSIAAAALLGFLWEQRHHRRPLIVVIDEAHNVCPQDPIDANQALATEHVVRIAGEGRKYGIYLLLSTQRPSKVHRNVLSQCDNLLLMRMNSAADIATLAETFSFAPTPLVEQAAGFQLGEGLAAGKIAPDPLLFKSGRRFTVEGGSDVSSRWADPR